MKTISQFTTVLFLFLLVGSAFAQPVYTIPGAQQQPKWVLPLWFESGDGQKDTLYMGYDPASTMVSDPIFGEKWYPVDTSKFNVGINIIDSTVRKVSINPNGGGGAFNFYKAKFPVTMTWDKTLFYSDSLPWNQNHPDSVPKAYGEVECSDFDPNYANCFWFSTPHSPPFLLPSDPLEYLYPTWRYLYEPCDFSPPTALPYGNNVPCIASDSIVWYGDTATAPTGLFFGVKAYEKMVGLPTRPYTDVQVTIFPNPMRGQAVLSIASNTLHGPYTLILHDLAGKAVWRQTFQVEQTTINTQELSHGMYIYQLKQDQTLIAVGKIIVQ